MAVRRPERLALPAKRGRKQAAIRRPAQADGPPIRLNRLSLDWMGWLGSGGSHLELCGVIEALARRSGDGFYHGGDTVEQFVDCREGLEDPRSGNAGLHDFHELLMIVLCGGQGAVDMVEFGKAKQPFLLGVLKLGNGIPSHD